MRRQSGIVVGFTFISSYYFGRGGLHVSAPLAHPVGHNEYPSCGEKDSAYLSEAEYPFL